MRKILEGPFDRDDEDDFLDDIELGAVFAALGEIKKDDEDEDDLFDDEDDDLFDDEEDDDLFDDDDDEWDV